MNKQQQAFLDAIKEDIEKPFPFEQLGFESGRSPSQAEVCETASKMIDALESHFPDLPERQSLVARLRQAEAGAIEEIERRTAKPRDYSAEPPMPETTGWKARTGPSAGGKPLLRFSPPVWVILGSLLLAAVYWAAHPSRSLTNEQGAVNPRRSTSSSIATSADGTLRTNPSNRPIWQREDPSLKWVDPETPATKTAKTATSILGNVSSMAANKGKEALRNFKDGDNPDLFLLDYASEGNVAGMRQMLAKGADPNYCTRHGRWERPLMFAARSGNIQAVRFLLRQPGIDILAEDKDYQTARTYSPIDSTIDRLLKSKGLRR